MGRRNRFKKKKAESFNPIEQDLLESYLSHYYHAANKACFPLENEIISASPLSINDDGSSASSDHDDNEEETIKMCNTQAALFENETVWIAGHEFPQLTQDVLKKPYLSLPSTLESKHRRLVCELCIHVGLYQTSIGEKFDKENRRKLVSIHPDGFEYIDEYETTQVVHDPPPSFPVMECRPWYYRNDFNIAEGEQSDSIALSRRNKVHELTKKHREKIQTLAHYPHTCLREHIDTFDSFLMASSITDTYTDDVSIPPPIMIDSSDKMKWLAKYLIQNKNITELAFDIEAYNASKYKVATCLIQLCTNERDEYVIDVFRCWDDVSLLAPIFANPNVVKIGHGIPSIDIPSIHRDFGIFVINAFDTQEAAKVLRLKGHLGLAKLVKYYKLQDEETSKKYEELKVSFQLPTLFFI